LLTAAHRFVKGKAKILSNAKFDVIIVGGGFSGTLSAVQLLRRAPNLCVAVVDKGAVPGRGVAYGTKYSCHLLNVPAGSMSALPEDPDHFLRWARANYEAPVQATSFLPRALYGRYIGSLVEEVTGRNGADNFQWIHGEVSSITERQSSVEVQLTSGRSLNSQFLVLAAGNFPPADLKIPGLSAESRRYVRSPWSAHALRDIARTGNVLLIGSGLTSVDLAVSLKSENFAGHIHILSRRGLMPHTHREAGQWPQIWDEQGARTIRGLVALVRQQIRTSQRAGGDWREVIDSLRPVTQNIWQRLSFVERRRFLRHARSYWEVHRHRVAPEIGATIAKLVQDGQVTVYAGRVSSYREFPDHAEVELRDRKTRMQRTLQVDRVINCTGPETDCRRINEPLVKNLLADGLARPDPLFLGLDVDANGALINSTGAPSPALFVIGPARKGLLWETIAVPELRVQASELADHLVSARKTGIQQDLATVAATEEVIHEEPVS
jgi:uncharacterized NAD(P)/FAD-binding protein YdhS